MYNPYHPRHFLFAARVMLNLIRDAKYIYLHQEMHKNSENQNDFGWKRPFISEIFSSESTFNAVGKNMSFKTVY